MGGVVEREAERRNMFRRAPQRSELCIILGVTIAMARSNEVIIAKSPLGGFTICSSL